MSDPPTGPGNGSGPQTETGTGPGPQTGTGTGPGPQTRSASDPLLFFVNGKKIVEKDADPETTLLTYLRRKLGLTGTKLGCAEGGCGACTVMLSRFQPHTHQLLHYAVNACLAPLCSLHLVAVTTVEGHRATRLEGAQGRDRR
ncbi:unnamed protein product [Pleuronectes platessa]|uniref:2Fe-2S ferredoxin-type domain-containing protein n=1 Tax=Pleuronectes platessa TaxID=8262 RepID=A0A9N7YJV3_PLEPL|nr:unnamed protein product [Pleuronectes platessa]